LEGDRANDTIYGGVGKDNLYGIWDNDKINGGPGGDTICGENCNTPSTITGMDVLFGADGSDDIHGERGRDELRSGNQGDTLDGGDGPDRFYGGPGDDTIFTGADTSFPRPDGRPDNVHCGGGTDKVRYEQGIDIVSSDCEVARPY
jgi:Ca2+-binding RTX toxin-like protein